MSTKTTASPTAPARHFTAEIDNAERIIRRAIANRDDAERNLEMAQLALERAEWNLGEIRANLAAAVAPVTVEVEVRGGLEIHLLVNGKAICQFTPDDLARLCGNLMEARRLVVETKAAR